MKLSKKDLQELNKTHTTQFNVAWPKDELRNFNVNPMISGKSSMTIITPNTTMENAPLECKISQSTETILMLSIWLIFPLLAVIYKKVSK